MITPFTIIPSFHSKLQVFSGGTGEKRRNRLTKTGYVLNFALPNFYFHFVTAYDILRAQGVDIGKRHYLGRE
jgi:hypothetical protein